MNDVVDLESVRIEREAQQPVWHNVKGTCRSCGASAISTQHVECPLDDTECSCGAWAFCVMHFVLDDGALEPRLELVP